MLEGFRFIGMEREAEYAEIALKRIEYWAGEASEPVREPPLPLFEVLENQSE
jgi:DNA modification methylase